MVTFKDSLCTVKISEDKFYQEIDPAHNKYKKKYVQKPGVFAMCVAASVNNVMKKLRSMDNYTLLSRIGACNPPYYASSSSYDRHLQQHTE